MTPKQAETITVTAAATALGISQSSAYTAIRAGDFPVPVIKVGGRYVIPRRPFMELLGLDEIPAAA